MTNKQLQFNVARTNILKALHYHRYFGRPIDGFSESHNEARAKVNTTTVTMYAQAAGKCAAWAGLGLLEAKALIAPNALWFEVSLIWEQFECGYTAAERDVVDANPDFEGGGGE